MLFPTVEYAMFFLLSLLLGWGSLGLRGAPAPAEGNSASGTPFRHTLHKFVLLVLSYVFYGFWDWHYVPLLFVISLVAWLATRGIQAGHGRRPWLLLGLVCCLGLLGWYKYTGFLLQNLTTLAAEFGIALDFSLEAPSLPLAISFMTFHAISMMMDAWRGKLDEKAPLLDSLLYVSFFPQLIAGPILRASVFLPQLRRPPDPRRLDTGRAFLLITVGMFKKVVIANTLSTLLVDDAFANPAGVSASQMLLAIYGYAAQIYCDFSGYTDVAIGCALLLGYRFPLNFDSPYKARSPQEFWHRWHISLSTWLRDYLYIPLGGSRGGESGTARNLMITMLLGGLWHGAAWNFVAWGGWHGLLLVLHRRWDRFWQGRTADWRSSTAWRWLARALCFHAVCLGWIFFRASDFNAGLAVVLRLFDGAWANDLPLAPMLCCLLGIGMQYLPERSLRALQLSLTRLQPAVRGAAFAGLMTLCEILGPSEPAPFIYFQF